MASTSGENAVPTDPDAANTDEARLFVSVLGPDLGPAVYMHMIGLMAILDSTATPILHPALRVYAKKNEIDTTLIVAEDAEHMTIANNESQARRFRRDLLLKRYRETLELGDTILRAPQ